MLPECLLCCGVIVALSSWILLYIIVYLTSEQYPKIWRHKNENFFFNIGTGKEQPCPSLNDPWSVHLSVIVPAYNEELRLPPMLNECLKYLEKQTKSGFTYEVIIVSDGSTDKTVDVAQYYASKYSTVRVLNLVKNRGKGGAVRLGMMSARGSALLFADADGATKFDNIKKLDRSLIDILGFDYINKPEETALSNAIICGSRAHLENEEIAKRSCFRLFLMHGFQLLVWLFCVKDIQDTQCGFKLLTRKAARRVFKALHVERWAFDVEMLYIAQRLNIPVTEIAVDWMEMEGSKLVPFWSWLQMGMDLFFIWFRYKIGAWKINKSS